MEELFLELLEVLDMLIAFRVNIYTDQFGMADDVFFSPAGEESATYCNCRQSGFNLVSTVFIVNCPKLIDCFGILG